MNFLKNSKSTSTLLSIISFLVLLQTVYSETILDKNCDYYCNVTGKKYNGNTISKNYDGITLREHIKKLGADYEYYLPCCDGKLISREHVDVANNKAEIQKDVNVNMKGSYQYMDSDKHCSTYCAINIKEKKAYFKNSEDLSLTEYAKKYAKKYDLFTYCCDNTFKTDRMTLTRDLEEFSLNVSYFTIDEGSKTQSGNELKEDFLNSTCDYYCNVKDKVIISLKKNEGNLKISEYANKMKSSSFDSFIWCCDGEMKSRSNIPVYNKDGSVSLYQDLKAQYTYKYMNDGKSCDTYCGFNDSKKSIGFIKGTTNLKQTAEANKSNYDYFTYCCKKEEDLKKSVVVIKANGEQYAVDTTKYTLIGTIKDNVRKSSNTIIIKKTTTKVGKPTEVNSIPLIQPGTWRCGPGYGRCPDGLCCSIYNYCGSTQQYCAVDKCQPLYGKC